MAGSMKALKSRMKSIESTRQITKAMELVASSRMRRARERRDNARPHFEVLYDTLQNIAAANTEFCSRFLARRDIKKTCYIVIVGDRGLAGGYNHNVFKLMEEDAKGREYCVLPVGRKSVEHYAHGQTEIFSDDFETVADLSVSDCFEMSRQICEGYLNGSFDEIKMVYTDFVSILTQEATLMEVLPFHREKTEERKSKARKKLILYEPSNEEVFDAIIPEYIAGIIYGGICESVASELAARRNAMNAATKNAGEMLDKLSLSYNQLRQAAITQEITEIISGAEA